MSSILLSLPELVNSYTSWVSKNPQTASDYETTAKWISYFIAGRIHNSHVVSELVYCLSNLLVLFNDGIIRKSLEEKVKTNVEKIKLWLAVVEYSEVFCELSVQKLWGNTGKWIVIVAIQVFKCIARLLLVYKHKETIIENPIIPPLERAKIAKHGMENLKKIDLNQSELNCVSFTLKRSGRVVRKIESSPPLGLRNWKPLEIQRVSTIENDQQSENILVKRQLIAETIYVTKPIIHLISLGMFGSNAWKPWMISLAMDVTRLWYQATYTSPFTMEHIFADHLDLEWQSILQGYLKTFSYQSEGKLYSYDEVLEKIFCPVSDIEVEQEVNYRDKEICEKCLIESLNFLSSNPSPPRQTQVGFLLNLAKYTSRDETCFINLNTNNVLTNLIYISQPSNTSSDKKTKLQFLELLYSFLEHQSGVKELIESKCWIHAYKLILGYQNVDEDIPNIGYKILTKLFEKAVSLNKEFCIGIIQIIAGPLLNAARIIETQTRCTKTDCSKLIQGLKPSILCLVEIFERLLERYSAVVLNCIMDLKVHLASDTVSKATNDKSVCLILDRISLILSFFKLTDIFDGIKSISHDPLAVTGFLRIVETEIEKGAVDLVFELYYYALTYLKNVMEKLPKCILKGKNIAIETELVSLQVEPILLISEKMNQPKHVKDIDTDMVRRTLLQKVLQTLTLNTLQLGLKIKDVLPGCPFDVFIVAVKSIIRSRNLYSKEHLGTCFEAFIYSLQDAVDYIKLSENKEVATGIALQGYILEILKAILLFIESFNLSWPDSVKILELAQILNSGCTAYQWPAPIVVQSYKLLQEIISRRLSPTMSLLIDCDEDLKEFGPVLYQKCFTTEWEIRKAVLDLVHTIAVSANKSFPSFRNLLIDASLPHLISTMALNDENALVRATAFKCLHEMILMENMEEILPRNHFINKVLDVVVSNVASIVKQEAIKFISIAYKHRHGLEEKVLLKVYKCLENVALTNPEGSVQVEALEFWRDVTMKHLSNQGWMDRKFPSVTFSKRIVCMTNKEVRKRIYKVLNELIMTGCLNVFEKMSHFKNLGPEAKEFLNIIIFRFNRVFREYEVTPESMSFNQEFLDFPTISSNFLSPPNSVESADSDKIIQEIINDTVMKMMPDDIEFIQDEDLYSLMDSGYSRKSNVQVPEQYVPQTNHQITPSEFVEFVYKRVAYLTAEGEYKDEFLEESAPCSNDCYNVIDY